MQPDLRRLICEHIIRVLHQKDVNQKQHICVKHDFVVSNHTISQLAFRYNPVEDSRFRQHVLIYTMMEVYPYCNVLEFKGETKGMFCTTEKIKLPQLREQSHYKFCLLDILRNQNISFMTSGNTIHVSK
ncbi:hypothetical protein TNCV_3501741 [Trichonephila clavipes]|uniref:Uncharacterized protein n=1 Tax=Trichonephila clavipes TaxID=2585209 RepID=A0A8X6S3N7_TRICX|nr:hypothetical protein TNCV_3501741 [Trichonephila clavipes]